MTPSAGEQKQGRVWAAKRRGLRDAAGPQERTDRLRQIVQIEFRGIEDPRHGSRVVPLWEWWAADTSDSRSFMIAVPQLDGSRRDEKRLLMQDHAIAEIAWFRSTVFAEYRFLYLVHRERRRSAVACHSPLLERILSFR